MEANHLTKLLTIFKRASGQKINSSKSSVFFSCNTEVGKKMKSVINCNFERRMITANI